MKPVQSQKEKQAPLKLKDGKDRIPEQMQLAGRSSRAPSDGRRAQAPAPSAPEETAAKSGSAPGDEPSKSGRLALIKARHEAMKREIDQIREDLESEDEE